MDLGFERAGYSFKWACELDPNAAGIYKNHWPDVKLYANVTKMEAEHVEPVDVIIYGFPCTDISVAGVRSGIEMGKKSGLFFEALRLIRGIRPRIAMFENVFGLLSANEGRDFLVVLDCLAKIGYRTMWITLDSRWFGVAQRRRRVFGISAPETERGLVERIAAALQTLSDSMPRNVTKNWSGETDAESLETGTGEAESDIEGKAVLESPASGMFLGDYTWTLAVGGGKAGQGYQAVCVPEGKELVVRKLLPIEAERLQGWPDNHTQFRRVLKLNDNVWEDENREEAQKDSERFAQCGNGVTSPVAEFLAKIVSKELNSKEK